MSYLPYAEWVEKVLNPRDRQGGSSPWCFETEAWHKAYTTKHRICRSLNPRSILEIGVRYGYSAHAFLYGAEDLVSYVGIDLDDASVNSMGEPTVAWAEGRLRGNLSRLVDLAFIRMDTQKSDIRKVTVPADFVHIDACHSYDGAMRDMTYAWELTKVAMLVDDYTGSPPVRDAVEHFVARNHVTLLTAATGTGEALLLK